MAKFHLSFLIGFSLVVRKEIKKNTKSKSTSKLKKSRSSKSSKSSVKSQRKRKTQEKAEVILPKNAILVDKPNAQVHLEYNLFPNAKSKSQIDILCWGPVAKVLCNLSIPSRY